MAWAAIGAAASFIAIIQATAKISSYTAKYISVVKNADERIRSFQRQVESIATITQALKNLESDGRLPITAQLATCLLETKDYLSLIVHHLIDIRH